MRVKLSTIFPDKGQPVPVFFKKNIDLEQYNGYTCGWLVFGTAVFSLL